MVYLDAQLLIMGSNDVRRAHFAVKRRLGRGGCRWKGFCLSKRTRSGRVCQLFKLHWHHLGQGRTLSFGGIGMSQGRWAVDRSS